MALAGHKTPNSTAGPGRKSLTTMAALLALALPTAAPAEETLDTAPLQLMTDYDVATTSWYDHEPVIGGQGGSVAQETSLEDRVAALERQLQVNPGSSAAQLPDPTQCETDALKQVDIITKPTYKLRGRIYIDGVMYDDDNATAAYFDTDRENEFGFDTARLGLEGYLFENLAYIIEVEFEGTETDFKDVFAEWQSLPYFGNFRAGHFKEPIGLEELTSSRFDTFMEQSYATTTFAPSRNYGIMIFNDCDPCGDSTWFLGTFRHDSDDSPDGIATQRDDQNDWSFDTRFAWLPYYDEPSGGRYLVHLGTSYSYRNAGEPAEFETGAWIGNQPPIGVGAMAANDDYNQIGFEFAVVWGALCVQSEYFQAFVTSGEQYNGAYVEVSYFLTGEHRGYKKEAKAFGRVYPFEPAFWVDACGGHSCGRGAWELTAGYSYVDLEDGADIPGPPAGPPGNLERAFVNGFITGLNWYLNPYSRVMFNYNYEVTDFVDAATPDSNANLFGVRWQVDW